MIRKILILLLLLFTFGNTVYAEDYVVYKNFQSGNKIYFIDMEGVVNEEDRLKIINAYKNSTNKNEAVLAVMDCSYIDKENKAEEIYTETTNKFGFAVVYDTNSKELWTYSKNSKPKLKESKTETENYVEEIIKISETMKDSNVEEKSDGVVGKIIFLSVIASILAICINSVLVMKRARKKTS